MYRYLFSKYIPDLPDRSQVLVKCIFHKDDKPSLSINIDEGIFHCFACGAEGGINEFKKLVGDNSPTSFTKKVESEPEHKELPHQLVKKLIEQSHDYLLSSEEKQYLLSRNISEKVIEELKIGYYKNERYYTIPIIDEYEYIGVITYSSNRESKYKVITYKEQAAQNMYPYNDLSDSLKQNYCLIVEGISDCLASRSAGLNAFTCIISTSPDKCIKNAKNIPENIVIITDNDFAGEIIRKRLNECFVNKRVYNVFIPKEYKDIQEYISNIGSNEFKQFIYNEIKKLKNSSEQELEFEKLKFDECFNPANVGKKIEVVCNPTNKLLQTYVVPNECEFTCEMGLHKFCNGCPINALNKGKFKFAFSAEEKISLIDKPLSTEKVVVKEKFNIPFSCKHFDIEHKISSIIEIADVIDESGESNKSMPLCYVNDDGILIGNVSKMKIFGKLTTNPTNHLLTIIANNYEKLEGGVIPLNKDEEKELSEFFDKEYNAETGIKKLLEIANIMSGLTGIVGRDDLHLFFYLLYNSPLYCFAEGQLIKSYLDLIIIGDTRTGKTLCAQTLTKFLGIGKLMSCENSTISGLLGGLQQLAFGKWMISWGILPRNDKKLVILDEVDSLSPEVLSGLTHARSTGIAEITKINKAQTNARTRLCFIGNPSNDISSYGYGIKAIRDFGYYNQDISRFDAILIVSKDEVKNPKYTLSSEMNYQFLKLIVRKSFSINPADINISDEVCNYSKEVADRLSRIYDCDIPILTSGYAYMKVLRFAIAICCGLNCKTVQNYHVDIAEWFIHFIYTKQSSSLKKYAEISREEQEIYNEEFVLQEINKMKPNSRIRFMQKILVWDDFTATELRELTGMKNDDVYKFISEMVLNNAFKKVGKRYSKTKGFKNFIVKLMDDDIDV